MYSSILLMDMLTREIQYPHGSELRLAEESIHWIAGGKKPLEITLPKHLRVVTVNDPPFIYTTPIISLAECGNLETISVELSPIDIIKVKGPWYPCPRYGFNYTHHYCCAGYAIDLLSNLSLPEPSTTIDTSFTFSLHLNDSYGAVTLGEMGYILSGALGELDSDQADIAIGGMTINPEREKFIDFSEPWLYHGIRILEKSIPRDSPMQSFLQPLKSALWTSLLISVIMVELVIFCLDLKSPFDRFYKTEQNRMAQDDPFLMEVANDRVNFGEAMWFVWGVLLNSGVSEKTPRSCAARVLGIVWCGFCMIMVASYTANLAAFLVLDQPEKGLTGITDPRLRNPSANFSFATVLNSNVYQYFKRHVELSTMFRKMEAHNMEKISKQLDIVTFAPGGSLKSKIIRNKELAISEDVFILVTGGVAVGALCSSIEVIYGRRKARKGRERALAARYLQKWRTIMSQGRLRSHYDLSRPVIRRGFAGLEPCTLADIRKRELARSKQKIGDRSFLHPSPFVPDLNFGRHSVALFCSRCRNLVETDVHRECGLFAYVWCVLFVLLFLWPCSPLPCFMEAFADFVHVCPICCHKIGRYRRGRRPKFYV
ncbi:glutamate [NMDA] receptor subunit zeta-1 domain protein [Necator americanus]|uniref:Glutamate [NMDA] receptor subunit zeta-1 domain protein n=1 Tax=Necator americanus TaxID=51031 RepID=W2SWC9_NECAM|nr:glutamate [NMDA] receptor subunit zeta-1 domain protein [Necator americanus]ETN73930.1 glutamate [NMDA] receptor subunit zeta-1 domain protein [Necator americanus]